MEINITHIVKDPDFRPKDYSASAHELGDDAASVTWQNALDRVEEAKLLKTDEEREEARAWIESTGGWERSEINAWTDQELDALLLQFIAGDIREYERNPEESGRLFWGEDESYYYIGN